MEEVLLASEVYYNRITANHKMLDLNLEEVMRYRDLIFLFTQKNFTVQYKQTILGPLWLIIQPLMASLMHMIVFGSIAKLGTDGIPQILFYFASNAIWSYFDACVWRNATVFTSNASLFGKVYFPRLTVPISNVLTSIIRFGIQMLIVIALFVYYVLKGQMVFHPVRWLLIPLLLIWLGVLGLGIGIIISSLTTKYRDLVVLVGFGMALWMYATPVVYPLSTVANMSGFIRTMINFNPVTVPVEIFRYAVLGVGQWSIASMIFSVALTFTVAFFGVIIFNKVERNFMDTV